MNFSKLFLMVLIFLNSAVSVCVQNIETQELVSTIETGAALGSGESRVVSFDQLPPELADQLREVSQKLGQQEKDRKREEILRAIVIGLVVSTIVLIEIYKKNKVN